MHVENHPDQPDRRDRSPGVIPEANQEPHARNHCLASRCTAAGRQLDCGHPVRIQCAGALLQRSDQPKQSGYVDQASELFGDLGFVFDRRRSVAGPPRKRRGAQAFTDLVPSEVRVFNNFSIGAETTLHRGGDAIYEAQVIWPGSLFLENIESSMYVAVISQFTYKGQRLVQEELSLTETEVLEGGTLIVTGSMWTGYFLSAA